MKHHLDLADASTVGTAAFHLTQRSIADAVRHKAMIAITGDAGLGKTYATQHAFEQHRADVKVVWVTMPPGRATMRRVAQDLLVQITGVKHEASRFDLSDTLVRVLGDGPYVVGLDEAQNGNREVFEYLRHIHDDSSTDFALALIGGHGAWQVLSRERMLKSRIHRHVQFRPWSRKELLPIIRAFHPVYADAPGDLLVEANERCGRGNFREWVNLTASVLDFVGDDGEPAFTTEVLDAVLTLMGAKADAA